jgi:YesN/AraC family two-component response regulator
MAISSKRLTEMDGVEIESHFLSEPKEALAFLKELTDEQEKIAVIVSDQQMPELTGIEIMEKANKIVPNTVKMLLTGYASLDSAKYAINHQILDQYISKPIEDYDNFTYLITDLPRVKLS